MALCNTQVIDRESGGNGGEVGRSGAAHLDAADLEAAQAALSRIGVRRQRLDPVAGSPDRALMEALTGIAEARRLLDLEAVAAGMKPSASPFFPLRAMKPAAPTRIAAFEARQRQHAEDLAAQERHAAHGRSGWAARQERAE